MQLEEIRKTIDAIDPRIRELIMQRMDASLEVAAAKHEAGSPEVWRPDREKEILDRLGEGVPAERRSGYEAVVRTVMAASRVYQYGLLLEWDPELFRERFGDPPMPSVICGLRLQIILENRPEALRSILGLTEVFGLVPTCVETVRRDQNAGMITVHLSLRGDLQAEETKTLLFALSSEGSGLAVLEWS